MDITVTFTVPDSAAADVISQILKNATTVTPIAEGGKRKKAAAEPAPATPQGIDFSPPAQAAAAPVVAAEPAAPNVAQLGTLVTEFMEKVGVPAARSIFAQFGIKKIVDLAPAKIPEFVAALQTAREMAGK